MVNSLPKVDFSHPTGHYTWEKNRRPLEKILGAPLSSCDRIYFVKGKSIHLIVDSSGDTICLLGIGPVPSVHAG